jgi:signal peptidase II
MMNIRSIHNRLRIALPVAFVLATVDCSTKELAVNLLAPIHVPHPIIGELLRFTLEFNSQAAMSLPVGRFGRPLLALAAVAIILGLLRMLWTAPLSARWHRLALGLLLGGAVGNLASRLTSARGVVDFIDVGFGAHRFYIFNVADVGVCCGAALLALLLWRHPPLRPSGANPIDSVQGVRRFLNC